MSRAISGRVWRASGQRGGALPLPALAESAMDDGVGRGSVGALAGMPRVTAGRCRRVLPAPAANGGVAVLKDGIPRSTRRYQVSIMPRARGPIGLEDKEGRNG